MSAGLTLAVAGAGGVGAAARFLLDGEVRRLRPSQRLPWSTIAINVSGSLLLGLLAGLVLAGTAPVALRTVAGTGFCGGYTTFSTATVETVQLARNGRVAAAFLNGLATLGLTLAAAAAGLALGLA